MAYSRAILMARVYLDIVAKRDNLVEDRLHNPRVVATRKVSTANALTEERVARKLHLSLGIV